jgi:hypothetical protein
MSQGKENIDKRLQEKLHAAEVTPPASVWDSIESSLDKKQRKTPVVLYRWLGSIAAVLLLGFLAVYFIRSERSVEPLENKLAQEVIFDSISIEDDSVSGNKIESAILEEKSSIAVHSDLLTIAAVQKERTLQVQQDYVLVEQKEERDLFSALGENNTVIALNKLVQEELSSIYKQNTKPLIAIKANFLKMIIASDDLSNQLAMLSARPRKRGWSVGIAYAPTSVERSSEIFTRNADYFYDAVNSEMSFVSEKDLPAYSGGVNLVYQLSERWSFQSGIYYLKQGQRIENFSVLQNSAFYQLSNTSNTTSNSYFGNIVFDNYAVISENAPVTDVAEWTNGISYFSYNDDLLQQFELIEIPLIANYIIINRKAVFSIMAGISPGILVGNKVYLEDYSDPIGKTEAINTLIYKSVLGVSFEYPLSRKLYFNLSPVFKYQLNNFNKNAIVSEKLRYLEFKTGLNYRF